MTDLVGQILGNYRVEEPIGAGGMGQVFRGHHIHMDWSAAIKVMHPALANDPGFQERFRDEVRAARALQHPHVVEIYDFGEQDGRFYLVMELVPHGSLRTPLHARARGKAVLPLAQGLELVGQAADALAFAHAQGIVHRDIKPDNMLLVRQATRAGDPPDSAPYLLKISDFGLARLVAHEGHTTTNAAMGTPAYMSPEQSRGDALDGRSDIYALGVVLYELVTGQLPFEVKSLNEAIYKHLYSTPTPPRQLEPRLPIALDALIMRCLAKNADDRPASAAALASELRDLLDDPALNTLDPATSGALPVAPTPRPPTTDRARHSEIVPRVQVLDADGHPAQIIELTNAGLTIGKLATNAIVLDGANVGRTHLRVTWDGEQVAVTDLGTRGGTQINDTALVAHTPRLWGWGDVLRVGSFALRLDRRAPRGAAPNGLITPINQRGVADPLHTGEYITQPRATSRSTSQLQSGRVKLAIAPGHEALDLIPGQQAFVSLVLTNTSATPDQIIISVDGLPEGWAHVPAQAIPIAPNTQTAAAISVSVPRATTSRVGVYAVTIRARSQENRLESSIARANWTVLPFSASEVEVQPKRAEHPRAATYTAIVRNLGNAPMHYTLDSSDDDHTLDYQLGQTEIVVPSGEALHVPLTVGNAHRWVGATRRRTFSVYATPERGDAAQDSASFVQPPRIPAWTWGLAGVLLLLLLVGWGVSALAATANANANSPENSIGNNTPLPGVSILEVSDSSGRPRTATPDATKQAALTALAQGTLNALTPATATETDTPTSTPTSTPTATPARPTTVPTAAKLNITVVVPTAAPGATGVPGQSGSAGASGANGANGANAAPPLSNSDNTATTQAQATQTAQAQQTQTAAALTATAQAQTDLGITASVFPVGSVSAGGAVVYTIRTVNSGATSATNVIVKTTIDSAVINDPQTKQSVEALSNNGWTCSIAGSQVTCQRASLASGVSADITISLLAPASATVIALNTATISSDLHDTNPTNDRLQPPLVTTILPHSDIKLEFVNSPDTVLAGSPVSYTLKLTNNGPSLYSDKVSMKTSSGTVSSTSVSLEVPSGQSKSFLVTVKPSIDDTSIIVSASAPFQTGNVTGSQTGNVSISQTTNITPKASMTIAKADPAIVPAAPTPGQPVAFNFNVNNGGPSQSGAVRVDLTLTGSATFSDLSKIAGWGCTSSSSTTASCTAPSSTINKQTALSVPLISSHNGGAMGLTAKVTSTNDGVGSNAIIGVSIAPQPDVLVQFKQIPATVDAATSFNYTVGVTNTGISDSGDVSVAITLQGTVTIGTVTGSGWTCPFSGLVITCTRSSLGAGQASDILIPLTAGSQGTISATAVGTTAGDIQPANNTASPGAQTTITMKSDLQVNMTASANSVDAGKNIKYTIIVTNAGPSESGEVIVTDTLPSSASFVSGGDNTIWKCNPPQNNIVICRHPQSLTAGTPSEPLTITVTAPSDPAGGQETLVNQVVVAPTTSAKNTNDDQTSTSVDAKAVADLQPPVVTNKPVSASAGAALNLTFAISNNGPSTAKPVVLVIQLSGVETDAQKITFPQNNNGWTCTPSGGTVTCNRDSLAKETKNVTINTIVGANADKVSISASLSTQTTESNLQNNAMLPIDIPVNATFDLTVAFSSALKTLKHDASSTYKLIVTNSGVTTAKNVEVVTTVTGAKDVNGRTTQDWDCNEKVNGIITIVTCDRRGTQGSQKPGNSPEIQIDFTAPAKGEMSAISVVSATDEEKVDNNTASATTEIESVDLRVTATGPTSVAAGSIFQYIIKASNLSTQLANTVSIHVVIGGSGGIAATPASTASGWSNCSPFGNDFTCKLDTLAGKTDTPNIVINVKASNSGTITLKATVDSDMPDTDDTNDIQNPSITITPVADLVVSVVNKDESVDKDGTTDYTVSVKNEGPNDADKVKVKIQINGGALVTNINKGDWNCPNVPISLPFECTRDGKLNNNESKNFTVTLTAPKIPADSSIGIQATVSTTGVAANPANGDQDSVMTPITTADLSITIIEPIIKTVTAAKAGIVYKIDGANLGDNAAPNARIIITISGSAGGIITGPGNGGWSCPNMTNTIYTCTRKDVPKGNPGSITITVKAPSATPNSTIIVTAIVDDNNAGKANDPQGNNKSEITTTLS